MSYQAIFMDETTHVEAHNGKVILVLEDTRSHSGIKSTLSPNCARELARILNLMATQAEASSDEHPDAITAKKFMERDPETLKKLGVFDAKEN